VPKISKQGSDWEFEISCFTLQTFRSRPEKYMFNTHHEEKGTQQRNAIKMKLSSNADSGERSRCVL